MDKVLRIPAGDHQDFLRLVHDDEEKFQDLLDKLSAFSETDTINDLPKILEPNQEFSKIILGLLYAFISYEKTLAVYSKNLYNTYLQINKGKEKVDEEPFINRINRLFEHSQTLIRRIVASHYQSASQNGLVEKKIITDIRPLFRLGEKDVFGSVIVNSLQLKYLEDGERKEIFLSLSKDDLIELKNEIEKSLEKIEVISAHIQKVNELKIVN